MAKELCYKLYPSKEWADIMAHIDVDQQAQQLNEFLKLFLKSHEIAFHEITVRHQPEFYGFDYNLIEGWELWNRYDIFITGIEDVESLRQLFNMLPYHAKVFELTSMM